MTEDETYAALCRAPIDAVDQAILTVFFEPPFCAVKRDQYELSCLSEDEVVILIETLRGYGWTLKAYLGATVIDFPDIR